MMKKIICLLSACLVIMSLFACGKRNNDNSETGTTEATTRLEVIAKENYDSLAESKLVAIKGDTEYYHVIYNDRQYLGTPAEDGDFLTKLEFEPNDKIEWFNDLYKHGDETCIYYLKNGSLYGYLLATESEYNILSGSCSNAVVLDTEKGDDAYALSVVVNKDTLVVWNLSRFSRSSTTVSISQLKKQIKSLPAVFNGNGSLGKTIHTEISAVDDENVLVSIISERSGEEKSRVEFTYNVISGEAKAK